jgi:hypothetical protein
VSDDAVLLMSAPNEPLALYWQDVLRDAGIPAMVRAAGPGFGGWGSAALLAHDLYVRRADLERAREIVAADEGEESWPS